MESGGWPATPTFVLLLELHAAFGPGPWAQLSTSTPRHVPSSAPACLFPPQPHDLPAPWKEATTGPSLDGQSCILLNIPSGGVSAFNWWSCSLLSLSPEGKLNFLVHGSVLGTGRHTVGAQRRQARPGHPRSTACEFLIQQDPTRPLTSFPGKQQSPFTWPTLPHP